MSGARVTAAWLSMREPVDAAARSALLVDDLRGHLPADRPLVIHDLACGTGSMLRWLAPQLPGPQHWICYDLDADLLAVAAGEQRPCAAGGAPVSVTMRQRDVTRLGPECADAGLITASAVLDLLTGDELDRLVATCVAARVPALLMLSVIGRVELWPPDPLDLALCGAFNAHQRRAVGTRALLGPDAAEAVTRAFRASGYEVRSSPSPWRLGAAARELTAEWLTGWLAAAADHRPELTTQIARYADKRFAEAEAGRLRVVVHHRDVFARPAPNAE